jgi:murein DD-endopeptidase MepM/ murein hydrolase activator NlpD
MKAAFSRLGMLGCAALAFFASGCATPAPQVSGREGFFERVAKADHSRQNSAFARMRTPAARDLKESSGDEGPGTLANVKDSDARRAAMEVHVGQLAWPLKQVSVTSPYGARGRHFHEGIDLRASIGTPVYAAQEGTVIYAGNRIRGYGRLVVVRHFREISTIYAHNSRVLVRTGQFVHQGQKIALSGNTGRSSGPHLHFEVRDGLSALNPTELVQNQTQPFVPSGPQNSSTVESVVKRDEREEGAHSTPSVTSQTLPTAPLAVPPASTASNKGALKAGKRVGALSGSHAALAPQSQPLHGDRHRLLSDALSRAKARANTETIASAAKGLGSSHGRHSRRNRVIASE